MKKLLSLSLVLLMAASLFSGCSSGSAAPAAEGTTPASNTSSPVSIETDGGSDPLFVGFSTWSLSFTFYTEMSAAFQSECEARGIRYVCTDSKGDIETQLNDCVDLLNKDVDVLIIASHFGESLGEAFELAEKKGIPIFMVDTNQGPEGYNFVCKTGTVNYDATYIAGTYLAYFFLEQGMDTINAVNVTSAGSVAQERTKGYMAGLQDHGITVNVLNEYWSSSRAEGMSVAEDALMMYSNIDIFLCITAQSGLGTYDACAAAKRDVYIIGMDGIAEERQYIDSGTNYIASTIQYPGDMVINALDLIEEYLEGREFEPNSYVETPSGVYTRDGEYKADAVMALIAD